MMCGQANAETALHAAVLKWHQFWWILLAVAMSVFVAPGRTALRRAAGSRRKEAG